MAKLLKLHLSRYFKAEEKSTSFELHYFSIVSLQGYGACSYLRPVSESERSAVT